MPAAVTVEGPTGLAFDHTVYFLEELFGDMGAWPQETIRYLEAEEGVLRSGSLISRRGTYQEVNRWFNVKRT